MMRVLALLVLLPFSLLGQVAPERFWIQFTDKDNTPYSVDVPQAFLSQRAIERRQRQNIAITQSDLPVDPDYVAQVIATGAGVLHVSKWMNSVTVHVADSSVLEAIMQLPFVLHSEPVGKHRSASGAWQKGEIQIDGKNMVQLPTDAEYGTALNQIAMLNGLPLHRQGVMGQGMLIAVLDAGFSGADNLAVFDSLRQNGRIVATKDLVQPGGNVYGHSTHGMAVLSTMAAYVPGTMIGTAPKAHYLLLRTEDVGSEFPIEEHNWIAGVEFADSCGADVLNTSLGYTDFDDPAYNYTYPDMDGRTSPSARASAMAAAKGMVVVTSAGNQGSSAWKYISTPADADSILAIGAVTADGIGASFSSIGPAADGRVKPDVCAQGQQAIVANTQGTVSPGNGTSFAGPILAGMAAVLWQAAPEATAMEVRDAIIRSAHLYDAPTTKMGHGIPDMIRARLILSGFEPQHLGRDELFTVHPSPFTDHLQGAYYSASDQRLTVRLVNGVGQVIAMQHVQGCQGCAHSFRFDGLGRLMAGIYTVQVLGGNGQTSVKVVKATP